MNPPVENSPVYVNFCFNDINQDLYFQTSDYSLLRTISGITTDEPIKVGDNLNVDGRKVVVEEIQVHFFNEIINREYGLVHSVFGKQIPYLLQVDVWTKDR